MPPANSDDQWLPLLAIPVAIVIGMVTWRLDSRRANSLIRNWADEKHLTLLECRQQNNRGPFRWGSGNQKLVYRIAVVTRDGAIYRGWIRCGRRSVETWWDAEPGAEGKHTMRDGPQGFPVILPGEKDNRDANK